VLRLGGPDAAAWHPGIGEGGLRFVGIGARPTPNPTDSITNKSLRALMTGLLGSSYDMNLAAAAAAPLSSGRIMLRHHVRTIARSGVRGRCQAEGGCVSELREATTRGQLAADHLAAEIEHLQVGDRLGTRKELCARLGVARATLNEAVRLLQERGLVTLRPGPKGGIFAAKADPLSRLGRTLQQASGRPDLVAGAIEVRQSLAALAAIDALRHRTDGDVNMLQDHLSKIEAALDDNEEFQRATWQLHEHIADIGANWVLQTVYRGVLAYVEANAQDLPAGATTPAQRRKRLRIYRQLVKSIIEQDEKACRRAVRADDSGQHLPAGQAGRPRTRT
jgi:DNA-binding FadR family transcriptional regulator